MSWDHLLPTVAAEGEPVSEDPRALEEDAMQDFLRRQSRPAQACLYRLLRLGGWNDDEALRELQRAYPRQRVLR